MKELSRKVIPLLLLFNFGPVFQTAVIKAAEKPIFSEVMLVYPKVCEPGPFPDPTSQFTVWIFCDDGQGTQIGVILSGSPDRKLEESPKAWWYTNKFWQDEEWTRDVTSYAWDSSGRYLYVTTSHVYGNPGLYQLDLYKKSYSKIYPVAETYEHLESITLKSVNSTGISVVVDYFVRTNATEELKQTVVAIPNIVFIRE